MRNEITWKSAIEKVLQNSTGPLHYEEITDKIISDGLKKSVGATPSATVNAQISSSIKHEGIRSPYERVARGTFKLRDKEVAAKVAPPLQIPAKDFNEMEDQYAIVSSFGMFWRREGVNWTPIPKLLGMQKQSSLAVDFSDQTGVYLLYDGREVIYVGRTTDRPLGKRLYEHTIDRMSARWDRFSWFGLLPVSEEGKIGPLPVKYEAEKMIPALEAILIEALEPRQNRKRGDDLAAVEYIQKTDPSIEHKKIMATISTALNKQ